MGQSETRIPCSVATRDLLRMQKRGGETYDTLLRKMVAQYEPSDPYVVEIDTSNIESETDEQYPPDFDPDSGYQF